MEQQLKDILEQQLRAPQTPEAISWWPLAPGWWIAAALLLALVSYAVIKWRRHQQKNNYRRTAATMLDAYYSDWQHESNDGNYLRAANSVLKRACSHFDTHSRKLSGDNWINYLNDLTNNDLAITTQVALSKELYQRQPKAEVSLIHEDLKSWLITHDSQRTEHSKQIVQVEGLNA